MYQLSGQTLPRLTQMFNSIHEIAKCITSLLGFTHALNDDVLSMFYPFSRWPRTAPALHPGCREANYLPSGGGREALRFFFHGRSFHFRRYDIQLYRSFVYICHFSLLHTQVKDHILMRFPMLGDAGCLLTITSKVLLPNQQVFMNSPFETAIWQFA